MTCSICGGMCLDPHFTEGDLDKAIDGADDCPFHGSDCEAVGFHESTHARFSVEFDCGARGPYAFSPAEAVQAVNKRGTK